MKPTINAMSSQTDEGYQQLEDLVRVRVAQAGPPLFTTADPSGDEGLFGIFLRHLPEDRRQHYNCHCCRRFINTYGGLVTIDDRGHVSPLIWVHESDASVPEFFALANSALYRYVASAKVTGVFYWNSTTWGTPRTGEWTHLSGEVPVAPRLGLKTPGQLTAEKLEDYKMLKIAISEYNLPLVQQAVRILESDTLDRSEKTLGVAQFFLELHQAIRNGSKTQRDNLFWRAAALAPPGFAHVRSSMIGTLLDDLKSGGDIEGIKRRWSAKMHPLQYQRPTALKEGNIRKANEVVERLNSAGSLARRFAKLEDVTFRLWEPKISKPVTPPSGGGAFDHLTRARANRGIDLPAVTMTWSKFASTVLPRAAEIEMMTPTQRANFAALVTAVNPDAPGLLQWDNHVSWYLYHRGSLPSVWNLIAGSWVKVNLITRLPCHWNPDVPGDHHGDGAILILDGCRDLRHEKGGGWFPECLKSEYREIRSAMEAFAQDATIAGKDEAAACGYLISKGQSADVTLRVQTPLGHDVYRIDRWD